MSDYTCPNCSCGFKARAGKTQVKNWQPFGDPSDIERTLWRWVVRFNNSFIKAFKASYYIQCPQCDHKFGESLSGSERLEEQTVEGLR